MRFADLQRNDVGFREVAVVLRIFLGTQAACGPLRHVEGAGLLQNQSAVVQDLGLAHDLVLHGLLDVREGVHVLELHAGAKWRIVAFAQRHVHVATEVAFLHVAIADFQVLEDLLQTLQVQQRFGDGPHVGTCHDLAKRRAATVGVEQTVGAAVVQELARVVFHVDAHDVDRLVDRAVLDVKLAVYANGMVVDGHAARLRDLVVARDVWIEVRLAREQGVVVNGATQRQPHADGVFHGLGIGHG